MLIVGLHGPSIPVNKQNADEMVVFGGQPNRLSEDQKTYPLIERIHTSTKLSTESTFPSLGEPKVSGRGEVSLPPPASTNRRFGDVARTRRSALDFKGGRESISFPQLATLLSTTRERLFADFATHRYVIFIFTSIASTAWSRVFIASGRSKQGWKESKLGTNAWWRQPSVWDKTWRVMPAWHFP